MTCGIIPRVNYAECRVFYIVVLVVITLTDEMLSVLKLNVVMLCDVMLSVIMLNVTMPNVMAPINLLTSLHYSMQP